VMRGLKSEVDAGNIKPYCFVEINGLKLASPENIYKVKFTNLFTVFGFMTKFLGCLMVPTSNTILGHI